MSRRRRPCAAAVLAAALLAGCGGSDSSDTAAEDEEVADVLEDLSTLKPGEFFIRGSKSPRFSGPYRFERPRYTLVWKQPEGAGKLRVALESTRDSTNEPYQLLLETTESSGRATVEVSGRLWVHVVSDNPYVLRFTPGSPQR